MRRSRSLLHLSLAALVTIVGTLLSGPVGVLIVKSSHPQPAWVDAASYIQSFHPVQLLPYYFGFVLLGGFLWFFSALPQLESHTKQIYRNLCYFCAALYSVTIFANYFLQIALVPNFLDQPRVVEAFVSDNAYSLFWYIEMVGYGFLGLATWFAAAFFPGGGYKPWIRFLLVLNGITSLVSAVLNFVTPGWVFSKGGLASYLAWNLLVVVLMLLVILEYRFGMPKPKKTKRH